MYGILSDFIYWLKYRFNSNILSFSDDIKIPQKSLFLHTFSWDLSLLSALKEWRQFKQLKSPLCFEVLHLIMQIIFYCKIMPTFFFGIINRIIRFSQFELIFEINSTHFFFFKIQSIKSNCQIIFLKRFPVIYFGRVIYSFPLIFIYLNGLIFETTSGCDSISL